jgi:hypothetical protein
MDQLKGKHLLSFDSNKLIGHSNGGTGVGATFGKHKPAFTSDTSKYIHLIYSPVSRKFRPWGFDSNDEAIGIDSVGNPTNCNDCFGQTR